MKPNKKPLTNRERLIAIKWYARQIIEFNKDRTFDDFVNDNRTNFASVFAIEQMSENSKYISDEIKERHDEIPWRELRGLRNRITHDYDNIRMDIVWGVVCDDLPDMIDKIDEILETDLKLVLHCLKNGD